MLLKLMLKTKHSKHCTYRSNNPTKKLPESTHNLKNLIRESLLEVKKTKEKNVLSEGKIVKARLSIISENVNLKTKKQKDKFFGELFGLDFPNALLSIMIIGIDNNNTIPIPFIAFLLWECCVIIILVFGFINNVYP